MMFGKLGIVNAFLTNAFFQLTVGLLGCNTIVRSICGSNFRTLNLEENAFSLCLQHLDFIFLGFFVFLSERLFPSPLILSFKTRLLLPILLLLSRQFSSSVTFSDHSQDSRHPLSQPEKEVGGALPGHRERLSLLTSERCLQPSAVNGA